LVELFDRDQVGTVKQARDVCLGPVRQEEGVSDFSDVVPISHVCRVEAFLKNPAEIGGAALPHLRGRQLRLHTVAN